MIVIGDIHGEYDALRRLVDKLPQDEKICFAGDMVDRGPKSRDVLNFIIKNKFDAVKGNHEYMFYDSPYNRDLRSIWNAHGGRECLASYKDYEHDIEYHRQWCRKLPLYKEYKDCVDEDGKYLIVSHTCINPNFEYKDPYAKENSMFGHCTLWENDWDTMQDREGLYDHFNIFGHTPQKWRPRVYADRACIDGGSFIKKQGFGRVVAMQFPSLEVWEEHV
jgi:serine/threonine protein phosphatase 1